MTEDIDDVTRTIILWAASLALMGFAFLCFSGAIALIYWMAQ